MRLHIDSEETRKRKGGQRERDRRENGSEEGVGIRDQVDIARTGEQERN